LCGETTIGADARNTKPYRLTSPFWKRLKEAMEGVCKAGVREHLVALPFFRSQN
jgi:hypothetical protein